MPIAAAGVLGTRRWLIEWCHLGLGDDVGEAADRSGDRELRLDGCGGKHVFASRLLVESGSVAPCACRLGMLGRIFHAARHRRHANTITRSRPAPGYSEADSHHCRVHLHATSLTSCLRGQASSNLTAAYQPACNYRCVNSGVKAERQRTANSRVCSRQMSAFVARGSPALGAAVSLVALMAPERRIGQSVRMHDLGGRPSAGHPLASLPRVWWFPGLTRLTPAPCSQAASGTWPPIRLPGSHGGAVKPGLLRG